MSGEIEEIIEVAPEQRDEFDKAKIGVGVTVCAAVVGAFVGVATGVITNTNIVPVIVTLFTALAGAVGQFLWGKRK